MKFLIILEKTDTGYSAFSPDLAGCVATGRTEEETMGLMKEAIAFHLEGMREEGLPLLSPTMQTAYVEVPV